MPKAGKRSTTLKQDPDAELIAMIARHGELFQRMDAIYERGGDDATESPEYRDADAESGDFEFSIVATPATTVMGLAAKQLWMRVHADLVEVLDIETLIARILELDAERVDAGNASRRRNDVADSQAAAT